MQLFKIPAHVRDLIKELIDKLPDAHPFKEEAMTTMETPEPEATDAAAAPAEEAAAEAAAPAEPEAAAEAASAE